MMLGTIVVIAYWVIYTIRKGYTPKLTAAEKANKYDLNRDDPKAKKSAQQLCGPLTAARWGLHIAGWAENVLLVLMVAWLVYLIGALMTGATVLLGYPV